MEVFEPVDEPLEKAAIQTGKGSRKRHAEASASQSEMKKFNTTGLDYKIQFNDLQVRGILDVLSWLHQVFDSLLDRVTEVIAMHDQVRFMHSHQLEYPISLTLMPREKLTVERILAEIERVIQSNDTFTLDDSITVNIIHVEMPYGEKTKNC